MYRNEWFDAESADLVDRFGLYLDTFELQTLLWKVW